jgi:hypothetical protein
VSDLLQRKRKRQHFPVTLSDDEKVFVRPLKMTELDRGDSIEKDLRQSFYIGLALVDEKGQLEFTQEAEEKDADFAKRVKDGLDAADFDIPAINKIDTAIAQVIRGDYEDVKKNSFPTPTPDLPTASA